MKLFAFYPNGHGEESFFVNAENEVQAFNIVSRHIEDRKNGKGEYPISAEGWGTDYYRMQVFEIGEVAENDNS